MFERYTANARHTIFFGRSEAIKRGSASIESEHILLALLRDAWLMDNLLSDVSVIELRDEFPAPTVKEEESRTGPDAPLSDESKRVLRNAAEEADVFFDHHIGNEHLLLGLLREKSCSAARMLTRRGLGLESLRSRIKDIPQETRQTNSGEQIARWHSAGIPEGYAWPSLCYNAASETIIVELRGAEKEFRPMRLFMRHKDAEVYQPIGSPAEDISYESPVTCEKQPVVLFNSFSYTKAGAGTWVGVYQFDLAKRDLSISVSKDNFVTPAPYADGLIAGLFALADDARHAYVKAALEIRHEQGTTVDYWLARLDLKTRDLQLVSRPRDVFF